MVEQLSPYYSYGRRLALYIAICFTGYRQVVKINLYYGFWEKCKIFSKLIAIPFPFKK